MPRPFRVSDPDHLHLRKGLRTAVVVPVVLAAAQPISDGAALYAAFAAFANLVFADFVGARHRVVRAYLVLAVVGALAVLVGSVTSDALPAAVVAMFLVAFTVRFSGCYGGYAVAASAPLLLAVALSIMTPPSTTESHRVAGWLIGSAAALVAALVAPLHPPRVVRGGAAVRCRELAEVLRRWNAGETPPPLDADAVLGLREELAASPSRPVSPAARYAAHVDVLDALGRASLLAGQLPLRSELSGGEPGVDDPIDEITTRAADVFDATAATLEHDTPVDPRPVVDALDRHHGALLAAMGTGDAAAAAAVASSATPRLMAIAAVSAATAAAQVARTEVLTPDSFGVRVHRRGIRAFAERAVTIGRFHLHPGSPRVRNSLRTAAGLALALVVARGVAIDHGFWVILGTLLVLRSSASDTKVTAVEALWGTGAGFVIAAVGSVLVDGDTTAGWLLLPLVTAFAAWAPGAMGTGTGQAGFTVFVVVLFNLITPEGFTTALVRLETVSLGIAIALVTGFVCWPRGSETVLPRATARHYRAARRALAVLAAERLGTPLGEGTRRDVRAALSTTRAELDETFADLAVDRAVHLDLSARTAVLTPPALVELAMASYARVGAVPATGTDPAPARTELESRTFEVETGFEAVADALDHGAVLAWAPAGGDRRTVVAPTSGDARERVEQIWLGVWLDLIERSLAATSGSTIAVVATTRSRWWH